MKLNTFLKKQFEDFIDVYDKYLIRTSGCALLYTLFCFIVIALLLRFSDFDTSTKSKQISLLSYFFVRYSSGDTYSVVDLSKTFFIFCVSFFSLGLNRLNPNQQEQGEIKIADFFKKIYLNDISFLTLALFICSLLDFGLFKLDSLSLLKISEHALYRYFHGLIFILRIYSPLMIFSLTIYRLSSNRKLKVNITKLVFLFIALWFFNEFAYELSLIVRPYIFGLVMLPFSIDKQFFIESFIGMILIAFYFIGYHSAMTNPLKLLDKEN